MAGAAQGHHEVREYEVKTNFEDEFHTAGGRASSASLALQHTVLTCLSVKFPINLTCTRFVKRTYIIPYCFQCIKMNQKVSEISTTYELLIYQYLMRESSSRLSSPDFQAATKEP